MVNLDLQLLFTNISLEKTIRNCFNDLFSDKSTRKMSSDLLKLAGTESLFLTINFINKLTECKILIDKIDKLQ